MTNLFAVPFQYECDGKQIPCIVMVADSQSSGTDTKVNTTQKMYQRGGRIIMETGLSALARQALMSLPYNLAGPFEIGLRIKEFAKVYRFDHPEIDTKLWPSEFYIADTDANGGPHAIKTSLFIPTEDKKKHKSYVIPHQGIYAAGSGSSHVWPMLDNLNRMGHILLPPTTPLDALILCYAVGSRAESDMYVNNRLQIGIVSPLGTRMLFHPSVQITSSEDWDQYIGLLTHTDPQSSKSKDANVVREEFEPITETIDAFASALETQIGRIIISMFRANSSHQCMMQKGADPTKYQKALSDLSVQRTKAEPLVSTLFDGKPLDFKVLEKYTQEEMETYAKAMKKMAPKP